MLAGARGSSTYCPLFQGSLEFLGARWTASILRALLDGPLRFTDLLARVPRLSTRLLSQRLDELIAAQIVARATEGGHPVYRLTAKGQDLRPVFAAVDVWNARWCGGQTR